MAGIVFLLLWVSQTIRSTQVSYQIKKIEEEIKAEERKQSELEIERNRALSLDSIESSARKDLGMENAQEKDIIFIPVKEN